MVFLTLTWFIKYLMSSSSWSSSFNLVSVARRIMIFFCLMASLIKISKQAFSKWYLSSWWILFWLYFEIPSNLAIISPNLMQFKQTFKKPFLCTKLNIIGDILAIKFLYDFAMESLSLCWWCSAAWLLYRSIIRSSHAEKYFRTLVDWHCWLKLLANFMTSKELFIIAWLYWSISELLSPAKLSSNWSISLVSCMDLRLKILESYKSIISKSPWI